MSGEASLIPLTVPLLNPGIGADGRVNFLKVLARFVTLTLYLLATVEINVALIAVASLVGVGKPRIERGGLEDFLGSYSSGHRVWKEGD